MPKTKIVILGTGGTIAGRAGNPADNIGYTAATLGVEELVRRVPSLADDSAISFEQVAQLDSKDMSFEVWSCLASRVEYFLAQADVRGVVITHGTDTLEETAFFLQALLQPAKPVVLTCAMRPASSLLADGPQNLMDAVAVALHGDARGVTVVCAGVVHTAQDVQKVHGYRLDAFSSGDAGPLGYVEESTLRQVRAWPEAGIPPDAVAAAWVKSGQTAWPQVEIVMNYAGAGPGVVEALVASGAKGIVAAGTGNGTLHKDLEAALARAQAGGIAVVRSTRCASGQVIPGPGDPFESLRGLTPVKARIALMLRLMAKNASA